MGGTPNYNKYTRFKVDMAAKEHKEKIIIPKYLNCRGTFDNCPTEEEFSITKKHPENPPEVCKKCVVFVDSKYYKPIVDKERAELFNKMMGKN